jgi:hypothetical protein
VPLSDDEQRILREIEEQLQTDEKFANAVSSAGLYKHSARTVWRSSVGMLLALIAVVGTLQSHYLVAFAAFVVMLGFAVSIERQLRMIGRAGVQNLAQNIRRPRVKFPRG